VSWYTLAVHDSSTSLPRHRLRNFGAFLADYVGFGTALALVNVDSVMPSLVLRLTDSSVAIGLVSTVFSGSWLLPQLAVARLVNDKPRKKPYMYAGLLGRVALLAIALALWLRLDRHPVAMLTLFFACLFAFAAGDGTLSVAWFDIMARALPLRLRTYLIGASQFLIGLLGIVAGILIARILGNPQLPFPTDYALLFGMAGTVLVAASAGVLLIKEPPPEPTDLPASGETKGWRMRDVVADAEFRRLMVSRVLIDMVRLTGPFYTAYAATQFQLPQSVIGSYVAVQTVSGILTSAGLGMVGARRGPQAVIRVGSIIATVGPLLALATCMGRSPYLISAYPLVFVSLGTAHNIHMLGFYNYLMELAPDGLRPAYIGTGNTLSGLLTVTPVIAGWLLDRTSFAALFAATAGLVLIGTALSFTLSAPRHSVSDEQTNS
jgi:hypothetical protein